jgi:hypothetical protein
MLNQSINHHNQSINDSHPTTTSNPTSTQNRLKRIVFAGAFSPIQRCHCWLVCPTIRLHYYRHPGFQLRGGRFNVVLCAGSQQSRSPLINGERQLARLLTSPSLGAWNAQAILTRHP